MIGVINVSIGNIGSVLHGLRILGQESLVISSPNDIGHCDRLIFPGVGTYCSAIERLRERNLYAPILSHAQENKPFLGICLGMQLLSSSGCEPYPESGLGLIEGEAIELPRVERFPVPHMGWNSLSFKRDHPVFEGVKRQVDVYFAHSFHLRPARVEHVIATAEHGTEFVAIVGNRSIVGVQFHPEKSQDAGLKILENFCHWDGVC